MKNVKDAAFIALAIVIFKLVFRLIPPAKSFFSLFEYGIWVGLGIISTAYIVIFGIVFLVLVVKRRRKKRKKINSR
jgi:Flp pilus assembly protein TadB